MGAAAVLRRASLSPRHPGVRGPGRRPARQRHRRPGLHVRQRGRVAAARAGRARLRQLGARHQRQPVLRRRAGPARARRGLHRLRPLHPGRRRDRAHVRAHQHGRSPAHEALFAAGRHHAVRPLTPPVVPLTFTASELCQRGGVTLPTLKFYLREGLLPAGDPSRPGRAYYDERHLRRLSLIRSLQQLAGLPLGTIRALLEAIDRAPGDLIEQVAPTIDALVPAAPLSPEERRAAAQVDEAIARWGLAVRPAAAGRVQLARSLVALGDALGQPLTPEALEPYLAALAPLARAEVESGADELAPGGDRAVELTLLDLEYLPHEAQVTVLDLHEDRVLVRLRRWLDERPLVEREARVNVGWAQSCRLALEVHAR
ncbi:MAG: MerR family transcriptional regulator, partial [Myxococcales bacterium]